MAVGTLVVITTTGSTGSANADAADPSFFVDITKVKPNVKLAKQQDDASTGTFTVNCGENQNGHFNPDNFIAQPGIKNGAQHLHDYVGNLSTNADSTNESLVKAGTTCKNGDQSAYFWPVIRIDREDNAAKQQKDQKQQQNKKNQQQKQNQDANKDNANQDNADAQQQDQNNKQQNKKQNNNAAQNDQQADDQQQADNGGRKNLRQGQQEQNQGGDRKQQGRNQDNQQQDKNQQDKNAGQDKNAQDKNQQQDQNKNDKNAGKNNQDQNAGQQDEELEAPQGEDQELAGNDGEIQQAAKADITFRGSPVGDVVPMPKFLRILYGDAKQSQNGPKNARDSWTCAGFEDRVLINKYPICPNGAAVKRIHDFPSCWDGKNTDSENHRDHIVFPDENGQCKKGFKAVPQLRITLTYNIPQDVQEKGQYKVDAFPFEEHDPKSDHDDFANVMSNNLMNRVVDCINSGKKCKE